MEKAECTVPKKVAVAGRMEVGEDRAQVRSKYGALAVIEEKRYDTWESPVFAGGGWGNSMATIPQYVENGMQMRQEGEDEEMATNGKQKVPPNTTYTEMIWSDSHPDDEKEQYRNC